MHAYVRARQDPRWRQPRPPLPPALRAAAWHPPTCRPLQHAGYWVCMHKWRSQAAGRQAKSIDLHCCSSVLERRRFRTCRCPDCSPASSSSSASRATPSFCISSSRTLLPPRPWSCRGAGKVWDAAGNAPGLDQANASSMQATLHCKVSGSSTAGCAAHASQRQLHPPPGRPAWHPGFGRPPAWAQTAARVCDPAGRHSPRGRSYSMRLASRHSAHGKSILVIVLQPSHA